MIAPRWMEAAEVEQLPAAAFLPLLRAGVAKAPGRTDVALKLARTLYSTDRMAEVVEWLQPALATPDADAELLFHLGRAAAGTGNEQLAVETLTASAAKGFALANGTLAEVLNRLGRQGEALDAALRGLDALPSDHRALALAANVLIERGEPQRLWALCEELRAGGVWGGYVPSVLALAATTPEQIAEVAALLDAPQWLAAVELDVDDAFNRRLAAELLANESMVALPSTKASAGTGRRIDQLDVAAGPLARELLARIRDAVERYLATREAHGTHPMIAHRPAALTLSSWALSMYRDGHETWHLHPSGWLSGVYYVEVPKIPHDPSGRAGTIEFGSNPFDREPASAEWPRLSVTPRAGLLLLFPSYFAHRTWPTGVTKPRICVAFDVLAVREPTLG